MDYKSIFSPQTLEKLNKKSAENLKKMLGDKNLIQTIIESQKLLDVIAKIEAPYKKQLEKLAVNMIKELYPIIDSEGIKIDAKITDGSDISQSLNEIIIQNPIKKRNEWLKAIYYDCLDKVADEIGVVDPDTGDFANQEEILFDTKELFKEKTGIDYSSFAKNLNESISPESRRRIINAITQGSAVRGSFAFYLFKEHLDELDPRLVDNYGKYILIPFLIYNLFSP
jgi:hypothetical protein